MQGKYKKLTPEALADLLGERKSTLLLCHVFPDADTIGSALALAEIMIAAGGEAYCASADPVPEYLAFLTEDGNYFDIPKDFVPERVVAVDVASPGQLGELGPIWGDRVDFMIDHHESGAVFADHYVDPDAGATGEIVFDMGKRMLDDGTLFRLPSRFWTLCYAAISSDTGGFRFANTTPGTMRRGAELLERGVDAAAVNYRLFSQKSYSQLHAEAIAFERIHLYRDGKIGITTMPYDIRTRYGFCEGDLGTLIDVVREVRGVEIAVAIRQITPEGKCKVSMRAAVDFNVADVCATLGGGGHARAAGCTVLADSTEDAEAKILGVLENFFCK